MKVMIHLQPTPENLQSAQGHLDFAQSKMEKFTGVPGGFYEFIGELTAIRDAMKNGLSVSVDYSFYNMLNSK